MTNRFSLRILFTCWLYSTKSIFKDMFTSIIHADGTISNKVLNEKSKFLSGILMILVSKPV